MPEQATNPVKEYRSPNGVTERSMALPRMPGADYSKKDAEQEETLTAIDFYSPNIALCPKTWSTSPGTMVRDISKTNFSHDAYESQCKGKSVPTGVKKTAVFKQSMNEHNTSGTFSPAALLYYHFSRYFDTSVKVPVAIFREMDRKEHYRRVTQRGVAQARSGMIGAGWQHMARAESDPARFAQAQTLFSNNGATVYGCMLKGKGSRYGAEINGVRSKWGVVQCEEFQRTAPYLALSTDLPLPDAIETGKKLAFKDSKVRKETVDASPFQMMYWMKELSEIALLDFIFSQQDRIGNIDYQWCWYWVEGDEVKSRDAKNKASRSSIGKVKPPDEIAAFSPVLIQRTYLNDNDAGGRVAYANYTKKTGMLQKLRHFSGDAYQRLLRLNRDLQDSGEISRYIRANFPLAADEFNQIVKNTKLATDILHDTCSIGKLQFDLDSPKNFLLTGQVTKADVSCI